MPSLQNLPQEAPFLGSGAGGARRLENAIARHMKEGQFFLACDMAQEALARFPTHVRLWQLAARAYYRTGNIEQARTLLEGLAAQMPAGDGPIGPPWERHVEETLGLLGRIYKEIWKRSGEFNAAHRSREMYLQAFARTSSFWAGINAATMSMILGEAREAAALARRVLGVCGSAAAAKTRNAEKRFWIDATRGEALLLLGDPAGARAAYAAAVSRIRGKQHEGLISVTQQLRLLEHHGFAVPEIIVRILRPPQIAVFYGHMIDGPGRETPRFPPSLEPAVRTAVDAALAQLEIRIGYSSAACGADLIFIEAMLDRGAEVNIVLPFETGDFIRTSVAIGGAGWVERYQRALERASSVTYITEEHFLGDDILFRFCGIALCGDAYLRAATMESAPWLLAAWDGVRSEAPGGTAEVIAGWPDESRCHVIRIDRLPSLPAPIGGKVTTAGGHALDAAEPGDSAPPPPLAEPPRWLRSAQRESSQRRARALLFADIVGYSQLADEQTPFYVYEFLERVAARVRAVKPHPVFVHTWGDAIFAAAESALPLASYAFALRSAVCDTNWGDIGLPAHMSIRISLHAGPVFEATDPLTGQPTCYGAQVNRAARIEPVTVAGAVYASRQFAAILTMEQLAVTGEDRRRGQPHQWPYICEYVGPITLPKSFGTQVVYQVRSRLSSEPVPFERTRDFLVSDGRPTRRRPGSKRILAE
jgi:class 3 adenylate cyclase